MVFSSLLFLYWFLPVFLGCYYLAPARMRNSVAVLGSVVFYAWGEPAFVFVLLLISTVVYYISVAMGRLSKEARAGRRSLLSLGLTITLGLLVYIKYSDFVVEQFELLLGLTRHEPLASGEVLIVGISFFTFQKVSYLVDVYRGTTQPARNLRDFLLFVMLFPQLIAGPIIRYHDLADQIRDREHTLDRFLSGLWRFLIGLGPKVLVANALFPVAERLFLEKPESLPPGYAWLGIIAFTFYIYFDFAGYSDMAIGLARMMGFEFMENFRRPYTARSVTEFWRLWHISLSNFMREYLYIPLGGNRVGPGRQLANLWIVFLASGVWHGASWNFIFWGACHGLLLTAERSIGLDRLARIPALLSRPITFLLIVLTWIPFQDGLLNKGLGHTGRYLGRLFGLGETGVASAFVRPEIISDRSLFVLVFAAIVSFLPDAFWEKLGLDAALPGNTRSGIFRTVAAATCLILASAALAGQAYNPFIYFRF